MASLDLTVEQRHARLWRISWADTGDVVYIWRNGVLIESAQRTWKDFTVPAGETLVIEVFDDAADSPAPGYYGRLLIEWDFIADAAHYRIDQWDFDDEEWDAGPSVPETGAGHYRYETLYLADATNARFRVVPVGANGIDGYPKQVDALIVRIPDRPGATLTYSAATTEITVS